MKTFEWIAYNSYGRRLGYTWASSNLWRNDNSILDNFRKDAEVLGYNLGHYVAGSNVNDYWRYSGIKAARAFISVSFIEPNDDNGILGDGVTDQTSFVNRQNALRSDVRSDLNLVNTTFINWPKFKDKYATVDTSGNNQFSVDYAFSALRAQGVEILANISCSPGRFPLANDKDYWPNKWEIWQHYYAQAYYLAKNYDVQRYGIMNEPNNWSPSITPDDWLQRLRVTSDAIQAAIADVNAVYKKTLVPQIFAPNTANGASKYDTVGDNWGKLAVDNRHLKLDGSKDPSWWNFHIYNYQKYTTTQSGTSTAYIDDYNSLSAKIATSLTGTGEQFPIALTEFNSRTASNYDSMANTSDSPEDYAALGASLVALTPARQLYLFKFAMTDTSGNTYPVAKNGTHYVDNGSSLRSYGGPSSTAESYRLYNKAAQGSRNVYATSGSPTDVWTLATKDSVSGITYLFIANKKTGAVSLDFAVSSLGIVTGSAVILEEVSSTIKGAVRLTTKISSGKVPSASMPAQSVWLLTILPSTNVPKNIAASENTTLKDGTGKDSASPSLTSLVVRADGTADGRRVTLLKFLLSSLPPQPKKILLSLKASTISSSNSIQAHVYGLEQDSWTEALSTFSSLSPQLKQNVTAGNVIANNIIEDNRAKTKFQGQIIANSITTSEKLIDVTDFVLSRKNGYASFIIAQEHRWTALNQLKSGAGDTQVDGLIIASRLSSNNAPSLKIFY